MIVPTILVLLLLILPLSPSHSDESLPFHKPSESSAAKLPPDPAPVISVLPLSSTA